MKIAPERDLPLAKGWLAGAVRLDELARHHSEDVIAELAGAGGCRRLATGRVVNQLPARTLGPGGRPVAGPAADGYGCCQTRT